MMAVEQEYDELNMAIKTGYNDACALFINSCSSCPHGMTLVVAK
jgi:hypothetical protein